MSHLADRCGCQGLILKVRHLGAPAGTQLGCQDLVQLRLWHDVRTRPHALQRCRELQQTAVGVGSAGGLAQRTKP